MMRIGPSAGLPCLLPAWMLAQNIGAALGGAVRDSQGLAIYGAAIEVLHLDSGSTWNLRSDETGSFHIAGLPAGAYRVSVHMKGFARTRFEPVPLLGGLAGWPRKGGPRQYGGNLRIVSGPLS